MSRITTGAKDIKLNRELIRTALSDGISLSQHLERIDSSDTADYKNDPKMRGLDAFQRQMALSGIVTKSDMRRGIYASKIEDFYKSRKEGSEFLLPEFMNRVWRRAAYAGTDSQNRFYKTSDNLTDKTLYPDYLDATARQSKLSSQVPLSRLVAITTPIDSAVYRAFYLDDNESEEQMVSVGEGATIPTATLTGGEHTISVSKFGRRLRGTYESFRRMRLDMFGLHIARMAARTEVDKVAEAINVLTVGDGNGNAASAHNKTTMDTSLGVGDDLNVEAYLNWRMQWDAPYAADIVLGNRSDILQLILANTGSANNTMAQVNAGVGGLTPVYSRGLGGLEYAWVDSVAANTLLGVDTQWGLQMLVEIGSTLTETDKIISQQFNEIVMSESIGYVVLDANAAKTLVLNA